MKRFLWILLVMLLLLSGCSQQEEVMPVETETTVPVTEPVVIYMANSSVEQQTGGAVKVFVPEEDTYIGMAPMGEHVVLVSDLSKLTLMDSETGELGSGLSLAECTPSPDAIIVRGPETVLRQIKKAKVSYDISNLTSDLQTSVTYTLLDGENNEVTNSYLSADTPSTMLSFELRQEGAVTVTVKMVDSPYLKSYMVKPEISPQSVMLKGDPEVIEGINQIVLADIDLSEVVENKTTEFTRLLLLPDGVTQVKGQKPFAVVKLELDGYGWQTIDLNQTNLPEDPLFTYPEQTFAVELFGEETTLRRIRDDDLTFELSYDLEDLVVGENTLPCRVSLEQEGIYIDQALEIKVEVTQEALDAALNPEPVDPDQPPVEPEE